MRNGFAEKRSIRGPRDVPGSESPMVDKGLESKRCWKEETKGQSPGRGAQHEEVDRFRSPCFPLIPSFLPIKGTERVRRTQNRMKKCLSHSLAWTSRPQTCHSLGSLEPRSQDTVLVWTLDHHHLTCFSVRHQAKPGLWVPDTEPGPDWPLDRSLEPHWASQLLLHHFLVCVTLGKLSNASGPQSLPLLWPLVGWTQWHELWS